jgi:hypothetical protein
MDKKKVIGIVGLLVGASLIVYLMSRKKSRRSGAGSHGGSGGALIGKVVKIIPYGIDGTSGEEDYDGTIYDAIFLREPRRTSRIESKVPQGVDVTYDVLDQEGNWVYVFSDIDSDDIYTGWADVNSLILQN